MAEEEKKESCCCGGKGMATVTKVLVGLVLIVLGVFLCMRWLLALQMVIRACIGPFLILVGLVFIAIAKE
jgi:hypothetical protein